MLLLGFALPPLVQLKNVPALRVIRRESGPARRGTLAVYALGLGSLAALLVWQAGDLRLGVTVVGGFGVAVALFYAAAWLALRAAASAPVARLVGANSSALRYGLANLKRHARGNAIQVASLALGLTAVLLLSFTRNDLVDAWRRAAPPDAPNRFVLGIQPDQLAPVKSFFSARGIGVPEIYPMVRGRLVAVNGKPVAAEDYRDERAKRLVEREFNLSYADEMPGHNQLAAGSWWRKGADPHQLSVEQGIAGTLGWKLGDALTFSCGRRVLQRPRHLAAQAALGLDEGQLLRHRAAGAARVDADQLHHRVPRRRRARSARCRRSRSSFPNLTVVDVGAAVRQAQGVIDQLINAVQFVFLFALGAGLLVLYSALISTEDERRREAAVMRVYGASRAQVAGSQRVEFLAMGLVAGVLATAGAAAIGQLLAQRVFDLDLPPSPMLLIAGPLAGLALLSLNAWLSSRKVLRASPALTLRESI